MKAVLLIDFGSTYTKVTAVDLDQEKILGTAKAFTTLEPGIHRGLEQAMSNLYKSTGELEFVSKLACSSAAGGLKMVAVGLVPELTAEAAKRAALSAGAKVMKVFSYELSGIEREEIKKLKPDIILLTGGTDGGNKNVILHNAEVIAAIKDDFPVVMAGNKSIAEEVSSVLCGSGKKVSVVENVMPEFNVLNIEPARNAIKNIFLERIIQAKGLTRIQEVIEGILMPTPSAVLNASRLLAEGYGNEEGWGDLMVIDIGGATTDVYSIAEGSPTKSGVLVKGLPELFAKRTVEGDLGVRYSALALTEAVGLETVAHAAGLSREVVEEYVGILTRSPELLPENDKQIGFIDYGLACAAVKCGMERHVGKIETSYSVLGVTYVQTGKDLSEVKRVIGTGGVVINSIYRKEILREVKFAGTHPEFLKPKNPEFFIDHQYIMAAMGLLGEKYPEAAIRILKNELEVVS